MAAEVTIVGSGPAGVAAACALADRGVPVRILDAGRELPPAASAFVDALGAVEPDAWPAGAADSLRAATHAAMRRQADTAGEAAGVDTVNRTLKPVFGSLFPYADDEPGMPLRLGTGVSLYPSAMRGGLSTAWGAAMLPLVDADLAAWPFGAEELAEHYRAVLRHVPLAGERDALAGFAPLYVDEPGALETTPQIRALLDDLARARDRLRRSGAHGGRARLAVWTGERGGPRRCRLVGLCLHGCPYGAIWSSRQTLDALVERGGVQYEAGLLVERVEERGGAVRLRVRPMDGGEPEERAAERVLLAAGVLGSTRIVLASLDAVDRPVEVRDSQVIGVPLLRAAGAAVSTASSGNTLAQAFLEIADAAGAGTTLHVQVYGFNDLMLAEAATALRIPQRHAERVLRPLLGRLLYAQLYLHSDDSGRARVRLAADGTLRVDALSGADRGAGRRALRRLARLTPALRAVPLLPMASYGLVGTGNHAGGTLPMRESPGELETDVLGRPQGFERVHVVDSSVFPSVPATTITFGVMANATRIAAAVAD